MLHIETGRYNQLPRDQRFCKWCNEHKTVDVVETEDHFLLHCEVNDDTRKIFKRTITDNSDLPFNTRTLLNDAYTTNKLTQQYCCTTNY